jgi:hypothetical protein
MLSCCHRAVWRDKVGMGMRLMPVPMCRTGLEFTNLQPGDFDAVVATYMTDTPPEAAARHTGSVAELRGLNLFVCCHAVGTAWALSRHLPAASADAQLLHHDFGHGSAAVARHTLRRQSAVADKGCPLRQVWAAACTAAAHFGAAAGSCRHGQSV